ncbi:uncharacterized protein LOC118739769 [Rhagoletis pomonella]|uniref:uncharacterized protein LOC118739769 n=1 Tax=Rhagoletis pomonella TaxID=28610 RepID=UPI00177A874D|nr:uncharacterized protein LOC118739769 [Rhagoletis pomonella]
MPTEKAQPTAECSKVVSMATTVTPLDLKATNLSLAWNNWKNSFKIYMRAAGLEPQTDQQKVALLLHHIGPDSLLVFNSFNYDIDTVGYDELLKSFNDYFVPKVNVVVERYRFFSRKQAEEETIEEFVTVLKNLSLSCEFKTLREDLIRDIFVCGLSPRFKSVKERLLSEVDLKLDKAVAIAKNMVLAKENSAELGADNEKFIAVIRNKSGDHAVTQQQQTKVQAVTCTKCGTWHKYKCPAEGVKCHNCGKLNHYAKMCYMRKKPNGGGNSRVYVRAVEKVAGRAEDNSGKQMCMYEADEGEEESSLFVGEISERQADTYKSKDVWYINIYISKVELRCQVDTGAQVNLISKATADLLKAQINYNVKSSIRTFSGEKLEVVGTTNLKFKYANKTFEAIFYILKMSCKNVIGLPTAKDLELIKMVNEIKSEDLLEKYAEMFSGLGVLKRKCGLQLKEGSIPTVDASRRIPFSLYEPLKRELKRMMDINVIEPVEGTTEWVSSIVIVTKPNGNLRICLDPKNLNKAIVIPRFSLPTVEECKSKMFGSRIFSTLDASSGFWMIPLNEESSKLCTFITPFGRYKFLRLPFGINAAPEIFHAEMVHSKSELHELSTMLVCVNEHVYKN